MRKSFIVLCSALMALALSSCSDFTQGHYTPEIHCGYMLHNPIYILDTLFCLDTLTVSYSSDLSAYITDDTLQVGDSVVMATSFYSVVNNLVTTSATFDSTYIKVRFGVDNTISAALDKTASDVDKCYLAYQSGYNYVSFPVTMTARKAGLARVTLKVESDSKYSPASLAIVFPVR